MTKQREFFEELFISIITKTSQVYLLEKPVFCLFLSHPQADNDILVIIVFMIFPLNLGKKN